MLKSGEKLFLIDRQAFSEVSSDVDDEKIIRTCEAAVGKGSAFVVKKRPKQFLLNRRTLEELVDGRGAWIEEMFSDRLRYAVRVGDLRGVPGVLEGEGLLRSMEDGVESQDLIRMEDRGLVYVGSAKEIAKYVVDQPEFAVQSALTAMLRRGWVEFESEARLVEDVREQASGFGREEKGKFKRVVAAKTREVMRLQSELAVRGQAYADLEGLLRKEKEETARLAGALECERGRRIIVPKTNEVVALQREVMGLKRKLAQCDAEREDVSDDSNRVLAKERVEVPNQELEAVQGENLRLMGLVSYLWGEVEILEDQLDAYEPVGETAKERWEQKAREAREVNRSAVGHVRYSNLEPRVGDLVVPKQVHLYVMYELLHHMELNGGRMTSDGVVAVLENVRGHKLGVVPSEDSQLRYFERFKRWLRRAGVEFSVDCPPGERSCFIVPCPGKQKDYVNGLIVMRELFNSKYWKGAVAYARKHGVGGLFIGGERDKLVDEQLLKLRVIMGEGKVQRDELEREEKRTYMEQSG